MIAVVGSEITIENYTPEVERFFRERLTFGNPEYAKKLNSGRWVGNTPREIRLYQRQGRNLIVPFGMLPEIFKRKGWFESIVSGFNAATMNDYKSGIVPYEYQENAIQAALKARQGIVVAPCGAGKTQIGLEIAARLGGRTLWLTHTHELLKQSMERAQSVFGLSGSDYGTITAGKVDIGNVITFATVQTMNKIDLQSVQNCWDVIITDEAHHIAGSPTKLMMFWKVISGLKARYKFGLTATPKRSDGLTPCMFALIGPMVYEIMRSDVQETTCPVDVEIHQTEYVPDLNDILMPDGTLNYAKMITEITMDANRNAKIVSDALEAPGKTLILTDRVEHIKDLEKLIQSCGGRSEGIYANAKGRKAAIQRLSDGETDILIATFALAREGLDVPSLQNVIFATPQKNETIITQAAGRVARKSPGKESGKVIDYEDAFGMLRGWQKKRISIYKKLGFTLH